MDKDQVIEIMGVAGAISAQSPYEIYLYSHLAGTGDRIGAFLGGFGAGSIGIGDAYIEQQRNNHLFVRFKDEVVESYGRRGDFDFMRVDVPVRQPNTGNSNNDNSFEMIQLENRQRQLEDQQRRLEDEQRYQNRPNPFPG